MELSKRKNNDYLWWGVACLSGAILWSFPFLLRVDSKDQSTFLLVAAIGLLLSGAALGYFNPERPWRWALASVLLLPAIEIVAIAAAPKEVPNSLSLVGSIPYLLVKVPIYALQGLPVLIGSYLGAYVKKRAVKGASVSISKTHMGFWLLGFILGSLSTIPYYFVMSRSQSSASFILLFSLAIGILFFSSMGISLAQPERVWRWAIAVGLGLPGAIICKIIIDVAQDSSSHNLFPIEIFISLVIAIPTAFAGAGAGPLAKSIYAKWKKDSPSGGT